MPRQNDVEANAKAYLAITGLMRSNLLSPATKEHLRQLRDIIESEIRRSMPDEDEVISA